MQDSNAKRFDLIPAISRKIKGVSEIRIQILVPHPKMHLIPTFGTPAPAREYYHPALSDKVTRISKVRFQILVPHPEKHRERTLHTPKILSYTRAFGDGPRNFEPWSSDVDDTRAGTTSP
ncbi:hypothetical protein TNCV_3391091 [Trichonephila clavipes]|nr:hypothetical protein TNCV_3391091 [Trichonephila clavipes]